MMRERLINGIIKATLDLIYSYFPVVVAEGSLYNKGKSPFLTLNKEFI
jgi:hypothetical protein